jgi:hypothetical protein
MPVDAVKLVVRLFRKTIRKRRSQAEPATTVMVFGKNQRSGTDARSESVRRQPIS